jgi:hypothetical protein
MEPIDHSIDIETKRMELRGVVRLAGEVSEDGLGDLGELWRADLPERGGIDKVQMAPHQRGEVFLRFVSRVIAQQFQVVCHLSQVYRRRSAESDKISRESVEYAWVSHFFAEWLRPS